MQMSIVFRRIESGLTKEANMRKLFGFRRNKRYCHRFSSGKYIIIILILSACITSSSQLPSQRSQPGDFYFFEGKKHPVKIVLNQIGIIARDGVQDSLIRGFIQSLDLEIVKDYHQSLYVVKISKSLTRQELFNYARGIKRQGEALLKQVGLVVYTEEGQSPNILTDEFIARFNNNVTMNQIEEFNKENGVQIVMKNPYVKNQFLLRISENSKIDALTMANRYSTSKLIIAAYPNFIGVFFDQQTFPNDPFFANQWHLNNTGQSGGTVDADADLPLAWDFTMGNANTIIAVLENGGFDMNHPDLIPNLWVNPGEDLNGNGTIEPGEINGVDDDGNGWVDDFNGWDFGGCLSPTVSGCGDNNPAPANASENHGTAVAGVAGARGNNALGVSGSCPSCGIMLLRTGYVTSDWAKSLAFGYAQQMGAQIITNSWGGAVATPNTITAINNAAAAGVVVLFAAGNTTNNVCTGINADSRVPLVSVFAVSSSSNQDRKVVIAANGNCIDILAPSHRGYSAADPYTGTLNITTTDRTGTAGYNNNSPVNNCPSTEPTPPPASNRDYTNCFGGTSSATPFTAGIVGLVLTVNPALTRTQVQQLLQDTADKIEDSSGNYDDNTGFSSPASGIATHSWGRVNAFEAVRIAAPVADGGKGGVDIFLRDNRLDWGNTEQSSNTLFEPTRGFIGHWRSMDIKVDAPPYQPIPTALTFDAFTDETPSAVSGDINRVYVRVRNRGPATASSVTVKLHWTQFGTALPALPPDFWTAFPGNSTNTTQWHPLNCSGVSSSSCTITNLAYSGSSVAGTPAGAAQIVQFDFPAPPVDPMRPNHFCLLGMIDSPQDRILPKTRPTVPSDFIVDALTPTDNNVTHRNYSNLPTSTTSTFDERFFVRNPMNVPVQAVLRLKAPQDWKMVMDKFTFNEPFSLEANQEVLVNLKALIPEVNLSGNVSIIQERVDVQPAVMMGGVTYRFRGLEKPAVFVPSGGVLSPYLTGTFDLRNGGNTVIQIINPTAKYLRIMVAFFDDNENPLKCVRDSLSPNDLWEINVKKYVNEKQYGVVKIVSLNQNEDVPEVGIVGYQRHIYPKRYFFFFKKKAVSETVLHSIPGEVLKDDLKYIWKVCK